MKQEIGPKSYAEWIETARGCRNIVFKGLDLREDDWRLAEFRQAETPAEGCVFIDCKLGPRMRELASIHFGIVFPELQGRPYHAYRDKLYSPQELFNAFRAEEPASYKKCADWKIFASYIRVDSNGKPQGYVDASADELVARRLHDHFISEELKEYLAGRRVVAFMGGHDKARSAPVYREIAAMARTLARMGYLVATGGGPGLMEAANLGAFLAPHPDEALEAAVAGLAVQDADRYDEPLWLSAGWKTREEFPAGGESLGVPTWFYGHEPPNVFASSIAKYFENSFREEGLLAIASHGVVFAEGNAGTVQEIFQDGCQNYYKTYSLQSPMILFDEAYWNPAPDAEGNYAGKAKPAWPLLRKLAAEKGFGERVAVTSDAAEVIRHILAFVP
ncbi:MAG: hypothetical protein JNM66_32900 [Bryobacterales bacterium]|nr:hypothetical protein [Bryobacterales bacterium]